MNSPHHPGVIYGTMSMLSALVAGVIDFLQGLGSWSATLASIAYIIAIVTGGISLYRMFKKKQ